MILTQKHLEELLHYDPVTGYFTWLVNQGSARINQRAGTLDTYGYIQIQIDGTLYLAHRLAFLYVKAIWPKEELDHKNRIKSDNTFDNLRIASREINTRNRNIFKNNTSGCTGVYRFRNKWNARININKKPIYLGSFDNKKEAIKVRKTAEKDYDFHVNHGI